jgi:hypothetical protein
MGWEGGPEAFDSSVIRNGPDGRRVEREVIEQEEKADSSNDVTRKRGREIVEQPQYRSPLPPSFDC